MNTGHRDQPSSASFSLSASQTLEYDVIWEADDNVTAILRKLEAEHVLSNAAIMAVLVLLAGCAISGNVCVLHVYRSRYPKTAGSFFIMALAAIDLSSAALCVPFDIFLLCYPYTQPAPVACRIFRFMEYWTSVAAGLTLTCVAFSRYFKIVKPLHRYSVGQARSLVIVMLVMALSVCWPQLVLSGVQTLPTRLPTVLGQVCGISDWAMGSVYPLIFYSALLALFLLCFSIMVAFYARIICVVWKRSRTRIGESIAPRARPSSQEGNSTRGGRRRSSEEPQTPVSTRSEWSFSSSSLMSVSTVSKRSRSFYYPDSTGGRRHRRGRPKSYLGRTTRMLGLVTFVALIGFVPFVAVQVVWLVGAGFREETMTAYNEHLAFQLCVKSHYLSSAANPLIYSVLSPTFRKESMVALKQLLSALTLATVIRRCRKHDDQCQ